MRIGVNIWDLSDFSENLIFLNKVADLRAEGYNVIEDVYFEVEDDETHLSEVEK